MAAGENQHEICRSTLVLFPRLRRGNKKKKNKKCAAGAAHRKTHCSDCCRTINCLLSIINVHNEKQSMHFCQKANCTPIKIKGKNILQLCGNLTLSCRPGKINTKDVETRAEEKISRRHWLTKLKRMVSPPFGRGDHNL